MKVNILGVAYRNVWKNKRRSLLNIFTFFFSVFIILYGFGMLKGQFNSVFEKVIELKTGHFKIYNKKYLDERMLLPLDKNIDNPEKVVKEIKKIKGIKEAAARIVHNGIISNTRKKVNVLVSGVDFKKEKNILTVYGKSDGGAVAPGSAGILTGDRLRQKLGFKNGDSLLLFSQTMHDANNLIDVTAEGSYKIGYAVMEQTMAFIDRAFAEKFFDMKGKATEIIVRAENTSKVPAIKKEIAAVLEKDFPGLVVKDWQEESPELMETAKLKYSSFTGVAAVFLFLAVFIIMNTLSMSVYERIPEIGTLRAIGMQPGDIRLLFIAEGAILAVFGVLLGFVLSAPIMYYLNVKGIPLPPEIMDQFDIPMDSTLKAINSVYDYIMVFIVCFVAGIAGALLPAMRAAKVNTVSALKKGVR